MLEVPEHRRLLLAEMRRTRTALQQARAEHRRALGRERGGRAAARTRLREDLRQHRLALDQVRARLAEDRRYHREALAANRWLLALADLLLPRWQGSRARRAGAAVRPSAQIRSAPDAKSGARPMGRVSAAPYPGAG